MENSARVKILVLFYSLTGQTVKLAKYIAEGAREIEGVDVLVKQVPEIYTEEYFAKHEHISKAREAFKDMPVATIEDLLGADGVAFGTPVHFGSYAAQLKHFIDGLTPVYVKGTMVGKPAALFTSAGSMHGGEEVALLSLMIPLLNLGMLPVGVPYPIQGQSPDFDSGSPYGAIFVSGHHGEKQPSDGDIKVARILGKRLAGLSKVLKHGCEGLPECKFLSAKYE